MQGTKCKLPHLKKNKRKEDIHSLPVIPDKRYFTIGEVADLCGVKSYILRYWEQEFFQIKPIKRRGNRRYYQHKDILIIRQIRKLLYDDGFTIEGARAQLTLNVKEVNESDSIVKNLISELEQVLEELKIDECS